jgi:hypothetical protein
MVYMSSVNTGRKPPIPFCSPDLLALLGGGCPKIMVRCLMLLIFGLGILAEDGAMIVCAEFMAGHAMICAAFLESPSLANLN